VPEPSAWLVLEDGTLFPGQSAGAPGEKVFELVFNTAMSGYQEILTDPSYCGQGVVMTYPHIGNYGTVPEDDESRRCWAEALVVRQMSPVASNWRSKQPLKEYLVERGVLAIEGVDTRALVLRLREEGELKAVLSTERDQAETLAKRAREEGDIEGRDLAKVVTCSEAYDWAEPLDPAFPFPGVDATDEALPIACLDFGVKRNILRCLVSAGFSPRVFPASSSAEEILAWNPAGIFLSNGPGDPAAVTYAHASVRALVDAGLPVFGICLGHQILSHVFGGNTFKLKFGHHGANHPVVDQETGQVEITSQNHSFAVDPESLGETGLKVTHLNANDGTVEGMAHGELPVFSVQYHPEAAPGPHDPAHLFSRFRRIVEEKSPARA
jgi:carbamoyl-phosphate synthase small subunit